MLPGIPSLSVLKGLKSVVFYVSNFSYLCFTAKSCQVAKLLRGSDGREELCVHLNKRGEKTADVFVICT